MAQTKTGNASIIKDRGSRLREFLFRYRGKVPIPLLVMTFLWLLFRPVPAEAEGGDWTLLFGVAVTLIGEGIRIWSVGYAGASTRGKKASARRLVTAGPYSYVRNPIYIGNFLVSLGVVLTIRSWFFTLLFVLYFVVVYSLIVRHEESFLASEFGDAYRSYTKSVYRFWPKWAPYARAEGEFRWKELRKEYWTLLGFSLGFVLVALSGRFSVWLRGL